MKAYFLSDLVLKDIDGTWSELTENFGFYSDVLPCAVWIEKGFISDCESVPFFRSKSKRAGIIHDYLCRIDAVPSVTKALAARVYLEAMTVRDKLYYSQKPWYKRSWLWVYRCFKSAVVRWVPDSIYWKKHKVNTTYEELRA